MPKLIRGDVEVRVAGSEDCMVWGALTGASPMSADAVVDYRLEFDCVVVRGVGDEPVAVVVMGLYLIHISEPT